jgi:hypothetical protein
VSTQREREAEKREQKLKDLDEAVESGSLTIRTMTPKERKANPPQNREPRRGRPRSK